MRKHCAFPIISGILFILIATAHCFFSTLILFSVGKSESVLDLINYIATAVSSFTVCAALVALGVCLIARKTRAVHFCLYIHAATLILLTLSMFITMEYPVNVAPIMMMIGAISAAFIGAVIKRTDNKEQWMIPALLYIPGCIVCFTTGWVHAAVASLDDRNTLVVSLVFSLSVLGSIALLAANLISMRWLAYPNGRKKDTSKTQSKLRVAK